MRIGIDIDGVLTNMEQFLIDHLSKYCVENNIKFNIGISSYQVSNSFNITNEQEDDFWNEYLENYATNEKARPFAAEIIKRLKEDGNEIYIIKARFLTDKDDENGDKMRKIVINWLKEYNIYYDKIIFSPEDKLDICLENSIDLMIEDKVDNINTISEKIPVICFDARYNQECNGKNIYRCFSWYDIYIKVQEIGIKNCKILGNNNFIVYAHRGASAYAPENTRIAFEKALELGSNGIELDLQRTKDGKIVIFHDDIIDNKSNGSGRISDYNYQELLELDFGSWFDSKYKNEKIVLFEDFASDFLNKDLTFAIELKVLGIEKETLEIINKYKVHNNIYISSFIYNALENVRKIDSNIKLSWLIKDRINKYNIEKLLKIKGNQICPKADLVSEDDIEIANNKRLGVRLWGISNEEIMKKVYNLNIEGMTVNFPDKLKELIEKN